MPKKHLQVVVGDEGSGQEYMIRYIEFSRGGADLTVSGPGLMPVYHGIAMPARTPEEIRFIGQAFSQLADQLDRNSRPYNKPAKASKGGRKPTEPMAPPVRKGSRGPRIPGKTHSRATDKSSKNKR